MLQIYKSLLIPTVFLTVLIFKSNAQSADLTEDFVHVVRVKTTPVENQGRTGTCWSFAALSFIESEILRERGGSYNFSEMYVVRNAYLAKAERYFRMHGKTNFSCGGEANDVTDVMATVGLVPEEVYPGRTADSMAHNHSKLDDKLLKLMEEQLDEQTKSGLNWKDDFNQILDEYLGVEPDTFTYNGKNYSPTSFANSLPVSPNDYILLTSFTHHPFYKPFVLEVPDNWSWKEAYNFPIDEFSALVDTALLKGYSMVCAMDVSEKGFNFKEGLAVVPDILYNPKFEKEKNRLQKKKIAKQKELFFNLIEPVDEIEVTQEIRQAAFDNFETQDDHGMHLVGMAIDKTGKEYYIVKNSWGLNKYGGYIYVSKSYFNYKTLSVMLHKNAIPTNLKSKLAIDN